MEKPCITLSGPTGLGSRGFIGGRTAGSGHKTLSAEPSGTSLTLGRRVLGSPRGADDDDDFDEPGAWRDNMALGDWDA